MNSRVPRDLSAALLGALAVACSAPAKREEVVQPPHGAPAHHVTAQLFERPAGPCGGARIDPRTYEPPPLRALAGTTFVLRRGEANDVTAEILAEPVTDDEGRLELHVAAGTYCLVEQAKREPSASGAAMIHHDPACLDQWRATCDGIVNVPAQEPLTIEIPRYCFGPCYRGPMPP